MIDLLKRAWASRRRAVEAAAHWSGVGRLYESIARPSGAVILMYHSIATDDVAAFIDPPNRLPPAMFERQMAFLRDHRAVIPLSDLLAQIASGISPPAGTVCLTFDDGYLDNLVVAAPILEKYRLPATLYLATGYVERQEAQWADVVHCVFQTGALDGLTVDELHAGAFDLKTAHGRERARRAVHAFLLEADHETRAALLLKLTARLPAPLSMPRLTLNWDEVRELRRRYPFIDIGGHTRNHVDLATHRGTVARRELDACAADLKRELGREPGHFSFPYGRWSTETREMVSTSGWASAVGDGDANRVGPATDRFVIPRLDAPTSMTELAFRTSGAHPGLLARRSRQ